MPSSPTFTDYQRTPRRFFYTGMQLVPQDALQDGKQAWVRNIRSYQEGTITVRNGLTPDCDTVFPSGAHSVFRLNDDTLNSDLRRRFRGVATDLYGGTPGGAAAVVDSGYSGDPLTGVVATPVESPRPYLYLGDSAQMRKVNASLAAFNQGIASPLTAPSAALAAIESTFIATFGTVAWVVYGGTTAGLATVNRINTTVDQILYDTGATGMVSIVLTDFDNITPGCVVDIGASPESMIVQEVYPAVSPTTIGSIVYDAGAPGICTIQPTGSFSIGQIELPAARQINARYAAGQPTPQGGFWNTLTADVRQQIEAQQAADARAAQRTTAAPPITLTRTIDYPVNCLVSLNGTETVRIISVAVGQDGTMSFRCYTQNVHAAGETITGLASIRGYLNTTKGATDPVIEIALQATITPGTDPQPGGVQGPPNSAPTLANWNLVGSRATQPSDIIRCGIKASDLVVVESVRLYLNLSDDTGAGGADFLHNYYFYEWRANDLVTAIMTESEGVTGLVADAQADAVVRGQDSSLYKDQYGQSPTNTTAGAVQRGSGITSTSGLPYSVPDRTFPPDTDKGSEQFQADLARQGVLAAGSGLSRQLALGNDQWITLECRVGDLTRVGTDPTLTLGGINAGAIVLQLAANAPNPVVAEFVEPYLTGGYGPDVAQTLPPYVYRYRYRSSATGAKSNWSPTMLAGVLPHRGRVTLTAVQSADPQADLIDWARFGGVLARWTYVGTTDNDATPVYNDDLDDRYIDGGDTVKTDHYRPFPVPDQPHTGVCNVVGNVISWVSGDTFDTGWAEGSAIIIDGKTTNLYAQPASSTRLTVVDNIGTAVNVTFTLPQPLLLNQSLPALFGGALGNAWFNFACGNQLDPGLLHWTMGNDPDGVSDRNTLVVTTASEPLQNGFFWGGQPFVASTDKIYAIVPTGGLSSFVTQEADPYHGFWSIWAFCIATDGVYFLAKDGVYRFTGGGPSQPVLDPDLKILFPQDGAGPVWGAIRGMNPIDFTATQYLKLTAVDGLVYFDYMDVEGLLRTLVYEPKYQRWSFDQYLGGDDEDTPASTAGVTARLNETGLQVHEAAIEGSDGQEYISSPTAITDNELAIPYDIWTAWDTGANDARGMKQYGDAFLDMNPGGAYDGIEVTPVIANGNTALATRTLGTGVTIRTPFIVEVGAIGDDGGDGVLSRNLGLKIHGHCQVCDEQRPIFYLWEPSFAFKQITIARRATDWEDLGYKGAKFVQGVVLRANTYGNTKSIQVQYDGVNTAPQVGVTLSVNHNGERSMAYPLAAGGWAPFIAELVRLQGADDVEWSLLDWRFVWEPAPELATQWETQYTSFGYPGFLDVFDSVIAYQSTSPVSFVVEYQDGPTGTYILPSSAGLYRRARVIHLAQKGKAVRFQWTAGAPFRLFKRDISCRVQPWGLPGGYQQQRPFGGPHFEDGAGI
jgi:hypothetical protein